MIFKGTKKLLIQIKRHPFAIMLFVAYLTMWLFFYYVIITDTNKKSISYGEMKAILGFSVLTLSISYSLINLLLAVFYKKFRNFYVWLTMLTYLPILYYLFFHG